MVVGIEIMQGKSGDNTGVHNEANKKSEQKCKITGITEIMSSLYTEYETDEIKFIQELAKKY